MDKSAGSPHLVDQPTRRKKKSKRFKAGENPDGKCGAKLRNKDRTCRQPAGYKTSHLGTGRCWLHGGAAPIKHGLYSTVLSEKNRRLVEELQHAPDLTSLNREIALYRGIMHEFAEKSAAAVTTMRDGQPEKLNLELSRLTALTTQIDQLSSVILRKVQIETAQSVKLTPAVLADVAALIGGIVVECFSPKPEQLERFRARFRDLCGGSSVRSVAG